MSSGNWKRTKDERCPDPSSNVCLSSGNQGREQGRVKRSKRREERLRREWESDENADYNDSQDGCVSVASGE